MILHWRLRLQDSGDAAGAVNHGGSRHCDHALASSFTVDMLVVQFITVIDVCLRSQVVRTLRLLDLDSLDVGHAAELVKSLRPSHGGGDAVLVFVSGVREIGQAIDANKERKECASVDARRWVLALYGSLPARSRRQSFRRPPVHIWEMVVAANVTETPVTIDDVGVVVDTGRMKENRFEGVKMTSCGTCGSWCLCAPGHQVPTR